MQVVCDGLCLVVEDKEGAIEQVRRYEQNREGGGRPDSACGRHEQRM
jgi:hypothetical protein